ncbi:MAG: ATP-binding protein, partial [Micromonosporaceae bacterium]
MTPEVVAALSRPRTVVLLVGPSGYGKSRLAADVARRLDGAVVVAYGGLPDTPYAALRELVAALPADPGVAGEVEAALLAADTGDLRCYLLCRAVRRALVAATVVLDDVDRADAASQRVLRCVLSRLPHGTRLLLTATAGRGAPLGEGWHPTWRFDLAPLSVAEIHALAPGRSRRWARTVHADTGGVPRWVSAVLARGGPEPAVPAT